MTHSFYFRLLTSFLANFLGKLDLLMLCGDIESNPGPRPNSRQSFSICHWNLNSTAAHNFSKSSLLRAYNAIHTYDLICLNDDILTMIYNILTMTHSTTTIWRYQVTNELGLITHQIKNEMVFVYITKIFSQ